MKGSDRRENTAASAAMPGMYPRLRSSQRLSGTPPATRGVALTFPRCLRTRHVLDDLCEQPPLQSVGRALRCRRRVGHHDSRQGRTAGYTRPQGRPPDIRSPSAAPAGCAVGFGPKVRPTQQTGDLPLAVTATVWVPSPPGDSASQHFSSLDGIRLGEAGCPAWSRTPACSPKSAKDLGRSPRLPYAS